MFHCFAYFWNKLESLSFFYYYLIDEVRLNGNGGSGFGRVEVYHDGVWGTVCDDDWDINDGHVVCRMLGYTHALEVNSGAKYGEGTGKIWLDDVQCKGNENNLSLCTHDPWGTNNCVHLEDAGVVCSTTKGKFKKLSFNCELLVFLSYFIIFSAKYLVYDYIG